MVRYLYAWTPLVIVGTVALLALPWLGLIAFLLLAPVALLAFAALAWAIIAAPYFLIRSYARSWPRRGGADQTRTALMLAERKS